MRHYFPHYMATYRTGCLPFMCPLKGGFITEETYRLQPVEAHEVHRLLRGKRCVALCLDPNVETDQTDPDNL